MGKESDLLNAIHTKNSAQVHKLLTKYCPKGKTKKLNLNHQDIDGLTVLHHAVFGAQHNVVQMLLEHCAPSTMHNSGSSNATNSTSHRSTSVSMTSCLGGAHLSSTMAGASVSNNSSYLHPDLADTRGRRPFHFACASHSPHTLDTAERLLATGCSSSMADCEGNTPLHVACANLVHGAGLVRLLLRTPLDCIVYNHHGLTPLDIACDVGNVRVVECLTAVEAVRRFVQSMSHTAPRKGHHLTSCLHMAAANGHLDVLRVIFTRVPFVNINHTTLQGTCLHVAALSSQWNVLLYLLQCGVDPNALNAREQLASDLVNISHPGGREVKHLLQELCSATQVQAIKEYKGNSGPTTLDPRTHITFRERELITVLNRCPDGMWKGFVTSQGLLHTGYFPASHVASITNNVPYSQSQAVPPTPCFSRPCIGSGSNAAQVSVPNGATPATKPPNLPLLLTHPVQSHPSILPMNVGGGDWWSSGHPHQLITTLNAAVSQCQSSPDSAVVDCSSPCACGSGANSSTNMAASIPPSCVLTGSANAVDNANGAPMLSTYPCYCDMSGVTTHGSGSSGCGSNRNSSSADSVDSGRGSVHTLHHLLYSMSNMPQQQTQSLAHGGNQDVPPTPASSQIGRANSSQPPVNLTSPASSTPVFMHQKSAPAHVGSTSSHSGSCTSLGRSSLGSGDDVPFPCHSALFVSRECALTYTPQQQEQQLCQLLNELQLDAYIPCFQLAGYAEDLNIVSRMTPEDLTAIGVTHPRHRKLIKNAVTMMQWPDTLPNEWTGSVDEWLQQLKLTQYASLLQEQKLTTLEKIAQITWEDLEEIGVTKLGHQKKLLLAIERLKRITATSGTCHSQLGPSKNSESCNGAPSDVINHHYPVPAYHYQDPSLMEASHSQYTGTCPSQGVTPPAPPQRMPGTPIRSPKSLPRTPKDPELSMAARYLSPARRRRSGAYENLSDRDLSIVPLPPLPVSIVDVVPPNVDTAMTSSMEEYCSSGSQHSGSSCSVHTSIDSPNSTYYRLPFANENCGTIRLNFPITGRGSVPPNGPGLSNPSSINPNVGGALSECSSPKHRAPTNIGLPPQMPQLPYDTSGYRRASLDRTAHAGISTGNGKAAVFKNASDTQRTLNEAASTINQLHTNLISKAAARVRLPNFEDDSSSTSGEMDGIRDALDDLQGSLERASLGLSHPGSHPKSSFSHHPK